MPKPTPKYRTSEYNTWCDIKRRCNDPKRKDYERYGGRGIKVCERWNVFENFLADMGKKPSKKHSIERMNNDGLYEPTNCKWATTKEQNNNQRSNILITFDGQTMNMKQWSEAKGIPYTTLKRRLRTLGWSVQKALTTPILLPHQKYFSEESRRRINAGRRKRE
jgi:hypothetical protein